MKRVCLFAAIVLTCGCATKEANLAITDASGKTVATGYLQLPNQLPAIGQSFKGQWHLHSSSSDFPKEATKNGEYYGRVMREGVWIDLNPGHADYNVILVGKIEGLSLNGKWLLETDAGENEKGSFTTTLPPRESKGNSDE